MMLGARRKLRREGPGHWVITPIALSLLIHALLLNLFSELSPVGRGALRERLRETFHISPTRRVVPATVEQVAREVAPPISPQTIDLTEPGTVQPLGTEARLVKPDAPTGVSEVPAGPSDLIARVEGPAPIPPSRPSPTARRWLADAWPESPPMSAQPVFLSRFRLVGPGPEAGFGAALQPSPQGEILGATAPQGDAGFVPGGSGGDAPGWDLGLPPLGVPTGLEGVTGPPTGVMGEPRPDQFQPVPREPLHEVEVKFELYREPAEPRAYFRMTLSLRRDARMDVIAKDVLIVVDVSRSIGGKELEHTRAAVREVLGWLNPGDRFNVALFSESIKLLYPDFVMPTAERIEAVAPFVNRRGGEVRTNVYRMLQSTVADLPVQRRPVSVFLISDGVSTAGIEDARRIVRESRAMIGEHISVFTFNAGDPSSPYLLDLLAYRSRGLFVTTPDIDEATEEYEALFREVNRPILVGLQANYGKLSVDETYPPVLPNLYIDRPVVIYGRCEPREEFAFRLIGSAARAEKEFFYHRIVPEEYTADATIAREWARGKVHHLVARMADEGERRELADEIQQLGGRYRIPTPYQR